MAAPKEIDVREMADCTCARLRRATRRITQLYDHALAPIDLTVNQFGLLGRLYAAKALHDKGLSIKALADVLGMDSSTLIRNLKPLEARGWVCDEPDPEDGRARIVAITASGTHKLCEAMPLWRKAQNEVKQKLGAASAKELRGLLDVAFAKLSV
jgi:DNA-binding MarR family transcriptional regulator